MPILTAGGKGTLQMTSKREPGPVTPFGQKMEELLRAAGLNKSRLSEITEPPVSQGQLSNYKYGRRNPSRETISALADALARRISGADYKSTFERTRDELLVSAGFAASDSRAMFLRTSDPRVNDALATIISALDRDADDLALIGPDVDIAALRSMRLFSLPASADPSALPVCEDRAEHEHLGKEIEDGVRAIRVRGDCMEPFYRDGDILFVREQSTAENGQRVIARVDDEHLNCKVYRANGSAYLEPTNGEGRIEAPRFEIRGVVVGYYRKER